MRSKNSLVSKAVLPVIENLEERRLMSAALTLVNPSGLPANDRLIFNRIQNPDATFPNVVHDTNVLEIKNTGDQPLTIGNIAVTGPWTIQSETAGFGHTNLTIPVNGEVDVTLKFTQSRLPAHSVNETNFNNNVNGGAAITGAFTISSTNDPTKPNQSVVLAGYWQSNSESNAEPNLTTITNLLAGYNTIISSPYSVDLPNAGANNTLTQYGQEVISDAWAPANSAQPVTITQLAGFHTQGNVVHTYWYSSTTQNSHLLLSSVANQGQTLLPTLGNGQLMTASFNPGAAFGFRVDNEYSSDAINVAAGNTAGAGHHFRFYPLIDENGQAVANTWIVAMDYAIIQTENSDYNDNVFIVTNMTPTTVPPAPTNLTASNSSNPVLNWTGVTYANLGGYNVYSSNSASGPFTKLTPSPISQTTFTDPNIEAGGTTVFYHVTAVDATSLQESAPATASANTPVGPVAHNDAFDANAGVLTTINVLANDTDANGVIDPTTVAVVTAPSHGTATVDPLTGVVSYTATAGFQGTDTFTYHVEDNNSVFSGLATVTATVSNLASKAPVATDLTVNLLANSAGTTVTPIATDLASTPVNVVSATLVTPPTHGTAVLNSDGVTFTYTPTAHFVGADSFTYTIVGDVNAMTSNTATTSLNVGVEIGSAKAQNKSVTYTDASGTAATVTITHGTADVYFDGSAVVSTLKGKVTLSSGSNLDISNIIATGTTSASALKIVTLHNAGAITLKGVNDTGTLGSIQAKNANLVGVINTPTIVLGGLSSITLKSASTAEVEVGSGFAKGITFIAGAVADSSIGSSVAIKSLKVASWSNVQNGNLVISAPSVTSLASAGNFDPNLDLSGTGTAAPTLGSAKITGQLSVGFWSIAGNAKSVTAGAVTNSWGANVTGSLASFKVSSGGLPADISAGAISSLSVTGNLTGNITATSAKNIKISGAVTGSTVSVSGNLTSFTAGSMIHSVIDVGTTTTPLLIQDTDTSNVGASSIGNIKLTSKTANIFSNSSIVASLIKSASLGQVSLDNGGDPEGLAAVSYKSLTVTLNGKVLHAGTSQLANSMALATFATSKGITTGDFGDFQVDFVSEMAG